jgi:Nif-specific regulatory protein
LEAVLLSLAASAGLAGSGDDQCTKAQLLSRMGMLKLFLSDFEGGFQALEQALDHAREIGNRGLEAEALQLVGLGHYLRANFDRALEEMGRALAVRREAGEEHQAAALESNLGLIHLERGDLEAAEERFRASLKLFRRVGLRRGEAVNLLNLGLAYFEMGRYERALDSIGESLAIRRELGDRRGEGADQGNLASIWIAVGRPERAVPLLDKALSLARELDNLQSESANECRLGQVERARGNPERALERFERGLEAARKAGAKAQEILALQEMARARLALDQEEKARDAAQAALALASSSRMQGRAIVSRALLAAALLAEGKTADADRCSREAVEELEKQPGWLAEAHFVWFERYLVLEAHAPADARRDEALRRSYMLLREKSDAFQDEELRQSYLENIPLHREINRLHESVQSRVRREASLRERSFHEIAKSIHSIVEIDPLLDRLLELAIETTHAEKGLIALKNPDGSFTIRAARGMARESVEDATDICRSVIADVAKGGEAVLAADAGSDDRFRERRSIISFRIRTLMCVPMKVRDEVMGAVYVDGRGASSFNGDDLEYLVSFSQLAAIAVENARLLERLRAENLYLRREVETRHRFESLVGSSPAMEKLSGLIEKVSGTSANVLITGETGTGKELVARAIHCAGDRRSSPFVTIDCGALPENLLESELFGHAKGAFSGAIHDRVGLFEAAEGGTIFLDEITNTSLELQAKLLRVLQESEIRRVGENQIRKVNVRVIVATNLEVRSLVERGKFREDLYYRLNVLPLDVPPLRDRREDIPLLALHFLKRSSQRHSKEIAGFTEEAMDFLVNAPWRGNVRELENLIEKAVILGEESRVSRSFLESLVPPSARPPAREAAPKETLLPAEAAFSKERRASGSPSGAEGALTLEDFDKEWLEAEKRYLSKLVRESEGNFAEAARRARVRNRNTLISRLKKHGLGKEENRE